MRDVDERHYREMFGEDLFRPRDASDVDVHPESLRGQALALMDATAGVIADLDTAVAALPWHRRWPARATVALVWMWVRLRHMAAKLHR